MSPGRGFPQQEVECPLEKTDVHERSQSPCVNFTNIHTGLFLNRVLLGKIQNENVVE